MKKYLLLFLFILYTLSVNAFSGGDGSPDNPYQISSCIELQEMNGSFISHYELVGNIDCSDTINWNNGQGFIPIGFLNWDEISGSFNGNGYTISGLYMNQSGVDDAVGLFIYVTGDFNFTNTIFEDLSIIDESGDLRGLIAFADAPLVIFENITIDGYYVSGRQDFGVVLGGTESDDVIFRNIHLKNGVIESSDGGSVGSILGTADSGITMENVYSKNLYMNIYASTSGRDRYGGLIGQLGLGSPYFHADKIYSDGQMVCSGSNAPTRLGGLIGSITYNSMDFNVSNSYSLMNITCSVDSYDVGGLIGYTLYSPASQIWTSSYYAGNIISGNGDDDDTGGIIANAQNEINNDSSLFYDVNTSGLDSDYGQGKTTVEMKTASTFNLFSDLVWTIEDGFYPVITDFIEIPTCTPDWSCDGYASCNASDLASCNAVTDANNCSVAYSGDYTEFLPQACNYCSYDVEQIAQGDCIAYTDTKLVTYTDNNFATCCDVTGIEADCYFGNESIWQVNESCSFFAYSENDIASATISTIVKFLIAIGSLVTIMVVGFGFAYAVRNMRLKR